MGDQTNLTMRIASTDAAVRAAAREAFENYSGGMLHWDEQEDDNSLFIGANECAVGSASDLAGDLDQVIAEGETDFAYYVHEDPAYEWLGSVVIHVPGLTPDYTGECDADGVPALLTAHLDQLLAIEDDAELRVQLRMRSGRVHLDAYGHYEDHAGTTVAPQEVSPANQEGRDR